MTLFAWILCLLPAVFLLLPRARAYTLTGHSWTTGSAVLQLQLGTPAVPLQDGSATWDASAANALALWNQHLDTFQFASVSGSTSSHGPTDGINSVFSAGDVYGQEFGSNTLAVTLTFYDRAEPANTTEADIIFNSAFRYDTYRGPLQKNGGTSIYDFHRIALHEFGHVLGLNHPDQNGQSVTAIMNSAISNIDGLQPDDISGAQYLYGPRITSSLTAYVPRGTPFNYQITTNFSGASYSASGLPEGLTIDVSNGHITGLCSAPPNVYPVTITAAANGKFATAVAQFYVSVGGSTRLITTFSIGAQKLAMDNARHRLYATVPASNAVAVIDTQSLAMIALLPVGPKPLGLSISPDNRMLYLANSGSSSAGIGRIDLETLTVLSSLPTPSQVTNIAAGLGDRLYTRNLSGAVNQVGALDGAVQTTFASELLTGDQMVISPDRTTLYAGNSGLTPAGLKSFDVSTSIPRLLQTGTHGRYGGASATDLKISHNATFLLYATGAYPFRIFSASDINLELGSITFPALPFPNAVAFSPDDGVIYLRMRGANLVTCVDTASFTSLGSFPIAPDGTNSGFVVPDMAVEPSSNLLFVATLDSRTSDSLNVVAAAPPLAPPALAPAKSLLNVSTRTIVREGESVMIGGFIIEGDLSKRVLLRALGRSLGVSQELRDPNLELYDSKGNIVASNNDWFLNRDEINGTGLLPTDSFESALVAVLAPGAYTAVVRGNDIYHNGNVSGISLVELYDLDPTHSRIVNISTRGKVETGDNVMIAGFIIGGDQSTKVIVRAIGPSLTAAGVGGALADTTLDLYDVNGNAFASNDDWQSNQEQEIIATTIAPTDPHESAIVRTLTPGNYTAIVRGKDNTTGVALVELYNLEGN